MKVAIVLNSGQQIMRKISADIVICADGGYNFCPVTPDYVVGDLDSVSELPENIKRYIFDAHKNFTDGEAAVRLAKELGATELQFFGVLGGRYDHILGNFNIMALADSLNIKTVAKENLLDIYFSRSETAFESAYGDLISVLPHGGSATVKRAEGVEYPLDNLKLMPTDSRGISNIAVDTRVSFYVSEGSTLIFHYLKNN